MNKQVHTEISARGYTEAMNTEQVEFAWKLMRYALGAVVFLAGLDKVLGTNFIVYWAKYVSFPAANILASLGISVGAFLVLVGIIEIIVGALAFTRYTMLASYISAAWLVLISINLLMIGGYIDIAIRDLLLASAAVATAQLASALGYSMNGQETWAVRREAQTA